MISEGRYTYLEGTKDTVPCCSPDKANIQESTERPPLISRLNREVLASGLMNEQRETLEMPNQCNISKKKKD
jgi:hypothetical protein